MRFTVERKTMIIICRNLARIVPDKSPIADLTGILIEADENTGYLRLTGNDMEVAIQYSCPAVIEEGGRMVINARLISDMMPLLPEDRVVFATMNNGKTVHIKSGRASYYVSYLPGTHYPKPEIPKPENMVNISGISKLAKQTAFAARKPGQDAGIYANVRLEVYPTEIRMIATDTMRLAIARHKQVSAGNMTLLIPSASLSVLAGIAGDEPVQAGVSKNSLVFIGPDFVFTSRTMMGEYMDVNEILKTIQPQYDALVPSSDLWRGIDSLVTVADGTAPLHIVLREDGVGLSYKSESSSFSMTVEAVAYRPTSAEGFHYSVNSFMQAVRHMEGNIRLMIDKIGMILLKTEDQCYMLSPVRPRKAATTAEKKKKSTKTKTAKAA